MSSAEKFLDLLEQKDFLPRKVLEGLRRQTASSAKPISAEALANHLVRAGHLTASQAQRLLEQLRQPPRAESAGPLPPAPKPEEPSSAEGIRSLLEEELGLAPLEEERPSRPQAAPSPGPSKPKPSPSEPQQTKPGPVRPASKDLSPKPAGASGQKTPRPVEPSAKKPPGPPATKPPSEKPSGGEAPGKKTPSPPTTEAPPESPASLASLLEEELGALEAASGGPGDLESLLASSEVESAAPLGPLTPVPARRSLWSRLFGRRAARPTPRSWDSPLILVGSGALVILILIGIVLILVLRRESGDALLEAAHADFAQGAYTQAIFKYNQFLERFEGHPGAGLARVRRGLAQIRQVVEEGRDWPKSLHIAQQVLAEIASQDAFREAQSELASLLPTIAKGLADNAQKHPDAETLRLAELTLELTDRYVPRSLQNQVELDEIRASLGVSGRRLNQQAEMEKTVAAIQEAIQKENPGEGYRLVRSLLREYPESARQKTVTQTLQALKEAFQKQFRRSEPNRPALTAAPSEPFQTEIPLAAPTSQALPSSQQEVVVFGFGGCVYALEAASGHLRWRRWTGPVSTGRTVEPQPLPLSAEPTSDLIVVGDGGKQLWRLQRSDGQFRWRHRLEGPLLAPPVLAGNHLLALSEIAPGRTRLEWMDLQTGAAVRAVELPQKVEVPPAVDLRRNRLYLAAEHSYVWVVSLDQGECLEVLSVGHPPGSIAASPLPVGDWLLVAENHRLDQALLKVLAVGQPGSNSPQVIFQQPIPGHVDTPPVAADRRLVVLTDRGAVRVYEIQPAGGKTPLALLAERGPEGAAGLVRFPLLVGQDLWVAGPELARFGLLTAQGRLEFKPPENSYIGDVFLCTPWALEDRLVHARYRPGLPGLWVAAVDLQTGKCPWETHLAIPPAREPLARADSAGSVSVVTRSGEIFAVDLSQQKATLLAQPPRHWFQRSASSDTPAPADGLDGQVYPLPHQGLLFLPSAQADGWLVLEKAEGAVRWKEVSIGKRLAQWPTPFADGLLVPTPTGRIELRDIHTGQELLGPFQPALEPAAMPAWSQPVVIPPSGPLGDSEKAPPPPSASGKPEFVVFDGQGQIYRVGIQEKPKPHLKAMGSIRVPGQLVGPIAVLGSTVWWVEVSGRSEVAHRSEPASETSSEHRSGPPPRPETPSGDNSSGSPEGADRAALWVCQDWRQGERKEVARLEGRCLWGPTPIGQVVLLATDAGQYLVGDDQGRLLADLRYRPDPPVGLPVRWQEGFLVATQTGHLLHLQPDPHTWKIHPLLEIGRPLASGPVVVQDLLILVGHDGTLYSLPISTLREKKTPATSPPPSEIPHPAPSPPAEQSDKQKPEAPSSGPEPSELKPLGSQKVSSEEPMR